VPLLPVGSQAPDFEARHVDGTSLRLRDLRGRYVLVYFYPKDMTPGCTVEACTINDGFHLFQDSGAEVIGVSFDGWEKHRQFQEKHDLQFALAADGDGGIAKSYGVGRMLGILPVARRVSFLVDPQGEVVEVWPAVSPRRHAEEVLEAIARHRSAVTA
jgi:peroxiredoxin Q/BCP